MICFEMTSKTTNANHWKSKTKDIKMLYEQMMDSLWCVDAWKMIAQTTDDIE